MGQGVNYVTGDYSRGASGFWVENGRIAYPVHEITIAGNLKDMLRGIEAVGADATPTAPRPWAPSSSIGCFSSPAGGREGWWMPMVRLAQPPHLTLPKGQGVKCTAKQALRAIKIGMCRPQEGPIDALVFLPPPPGKGRVSRRPKQPSRQDAALHPIFPRCDAVRTVCQKHRRCMHKAGS